MSSAWEPSLGGSGGGATALVPASRRRVSCAGGRSRGEEDVLKSSDSSTSQRLGSESLQPVPFEAPYSLVS